MNKRNEIGGGYWLTKSEVDKVQRNLQIKNNIYFISQTEQHLSTCRSALQYIAGLYEKKIIAIPYFTCSTVIDPFSKNGWTVIPFKIKENFKVKNNKLINKIHKLQKEKHELQIKNNNKNTNNKYLENIRKKAQEKLKYENVDIDNLIWEFLDKVEVYKTNDKNFIKLRVILNTGKTYGISFNTKKHPFCTNYTYDKS